MDVKLYDGLKNAVKEREKNRRESRIEVYKNTYQLYKTIWEQIVKKIPKLSDGEEKLTVHVYIKKLSDKYTATMNEHETKEVKKTGIPPRKRNKEIDIDYFCKLLDNGELCFSNFSSFQKSDRETTTGEFEVKITTTIEKINEMLEKHEQLILSTTENKTSETDSFVQTKK